MYTQLVKIAEYGLKGETKKVENNRCYGYIIRGRFKSLTYLRGFLVKKIKEDCPF